MLRATYTLPTLPPSSDFETLPIFKQLAEANRYLGELKGIAEAIPNQGILIDSLALQEAKASSEIENIVTTQDELFQADLSNIGFETGAAKEVSRYRDALKLGHDLLHEKDGLITNVSLVEIYRVLKQRTDGFRKTPGTALKNDQTGKLVYIPPQQASEIISLMSSLERFINDDDACHLDPLIKMAIIHHQFESIHPFPDGNGRIGRILNVLYLTRTGLLDIPILYLSRYITQNKAEYYQKLQSVRDDGNWEDWILYMLKAVAETSQTTLSLVEGIRDLMLEYKHRMRKVLPKIYSQDLLNNLFRHPYTRIEYVQQDLGLKARQTAARYLDQLTEAGFVTKQQIGRNTYFINARLVSLFLSVSGE